MIRFEENDLDRAYPLGFESAKREILTICEKAGVDFDEKKLDKYYEPTLRSLNRIRRELNNVGIALENDWGPGLILARELGLKIKAIILWTQQYRGHGYSEDTIKMMISGLAEYAKSMGNDPEIIVDETLNRVTEKLKRLNIDLIISSWWSNTSIYHKHGLRTLSVRELRLFFEFGISPIIEADRRIIMRIRKDVPHRPIIDVKSGDRLPYLSKVWELHTLLFHMNRFTKV